MEFKQFIEIFKRWYWLMILGIVMGAAGGILVSRMQEPVYQATAKTLAMRAPDESSSTLAFLSPVELSTTFSQLITTQPVLDEASSLLGVKVRKSQIQIQNVTNSHVINVIVEDNDPQMCAKIANELVEIAIKRFVNLQIGLYVTSEQNIQTELKDIQSKISSTQTQIGETTRTILNNQMEQIQAEMTPLKDEISSLQQDIARLSPVTIATTADQKALIAQKQARIDQIRPLLTAYEQAFSNLVILQKPIGTGSVDENNLAILEKNLEQYQKRNVDLTSRLDTLQQAQIQGIANVMQVEKAYAPDNYVRPQLLLYTLLATAAGFILAVLAIFILENMNITVKFPVGKGPRNAKPKELDYATVPNGVGEGGMGDAQTWSGQGTQEADISAILQEQGEEMEQPENSQVIYADSGTVLPNDGGISAVRKSKRNRRQKS